MGFFEKTKGVFISVMDGQFCMRVNEDHPKAVARTLTKGKNEGTVVHEFRFGGCTGFLTGVNIKESKGFSDELQLFIKDSDEDSDYPDFVISVPSNSRHAKSFMARVRNLDLDKPITFEPFKFPSVDQKTKKPQVNANGDPKYVIGWTLNQDDNKIESEFEKDDIPEMTQVKVKGKMEWDDSEQMEFFLNHLNEWVKENDLAKEFKQKSSPKKEESHDEEEPDEIPF